MRCPRRRPSGLVRPTARTSFAATAGAELSVLVVTGGPPVLHYER